MAKKDKQAIAEILPGQLSLWDIEIEEKPKEIIKNNESFTESKDFITENQVSCTNYKFEITDDQRKVIDKFKQQKDVRRIIVYSKGSIGIEIKEEDGFVTNYITRDGKEEFSFNKKLPVLPWDKIIYHSLNYEKVPLTKVQTDKLQKLLCEQRNLIKRVVHRRGDESIFVEFSGKIVEILPNGWQLEFESVNHIECEEDEIYLVPAKEKKSEVVEEVGKLVKVGDCVQALHGKETIEGTIVNEYGLGNDVLNIVFDNGRRHTAIGRMCVLKILKSA